MQVCSWLFMVSTHVYYQHDYLFCFVTHQRKLVTFSALYVGINDKGKLRSPDIKGESTW